MVNVCMSETKDDLGKRNGGKPIVHGLADLREKRVKRWEGQLSLLEGVIVWHGGTTDCSVEPTFLPGGKTESIVGGRGNALQALQGASVAETCFVEEEGYEKGQQRER